MAKHTRLTVSEQDKPLAWLDMDDATLGKCARWFIIKSNQVGAERAEAEDMPMIALMAMHAGIALCRFAHETNATTLTTEITAATSASGPLGDWKITVKQVRAASAGEAGTAETTKIGSVHEHATRAAGDAQTSHDGS
jgi:hypothetical protein